MLEQFTGWTLALMLAILFLTLFFHFFRYSHRTADIAPNVLTSLGIFGTFLGVALGLAEFDTTDIQSSVPTLMEGLKTAFWSSIVGLLGALSIKLRSAWHQLNTSEEVFEEGKTADDIYQSLERVVNQQERQLSWHQDNNPVPAIHALAAQLTARTDQNHEETLVQLKAIRESLENYQERMAEANAKALVMAIEKVMTEFNTKINEQYGDNFKRLNESVIGMLEWQKAYKENITRLIEEQERSTATMTNACDAFEYMVKHADAFNGVSASLEHLLSALEAERDSLQQQLGSLAELINQAASGLPQLEERVAALTSGMAEAVTRQQDWLAGELTQSQQELQQAWQQQLLETREQQQTQQQQTLLQFQRLGDKVERQVVILEESLEAELTRSLTSLGVQLASLSEKFVSDYSPLTDRLQKLVKMAEAVDES